MPSVLTLHNGGRPYKVVWQRNKHKDKRQYMVSIHARACEDGREHADHKHTKLVREYKNADRVWIDRNKLDRSTSPIGNTLLIQIGTQCVYVGAWILTFCLPRGDTIVRYHSPVGNADVPYPIAGGKKNTYFLL
jgi:hypothetical protein